jgi:hypothetical protein
MKREGTYFAVIFQNQLFKAFSCSGPLNFPLAAAASPSTYPVATLPIHRKTAMSTAAGSVPLAAVHCAPPCGITGCANFHTARIHSRGCAPTTKHTPFFRTDRFNSIFAIGLSASKPDQQSLRVDTHPDSFNYFSEWQNAMSNAFWSQLTRDIETRSSGLPDFQGRSDEELRSISRNSPLRRGMSERQFSSSMFPAADINKPSPQPFEATRARVVPGNATLTPQVPLPMPAAHASDHQQLLDSMAADAAKIEELSDVKIGLFSGIEDTQLSGHDVAALFQKRVLESQPTDATIYHIDDSVPPENFSELNAEPQVMPGARATKLSINEVRGWIAHARSGGMSNSEDPVPPHLEPVIVPPSPRSRSPRTILAHPDAGTYATADKTKGWREVVNKGAAESPALRALRFGRREYGEQIQREFSSQVTFDFKKDPAAAATSLGLDGGIEDSADFPQASDGRTRYDASAPEATDCIVEGTDGMQSLSMATAVAPDYGVYYAGADDEDSRDAGPASYSPSFSSLTDPDFQVPAPAAGVTSVVGLHGGVVVLTRDAVLPAWAHAPPQPALPGNAGFPASVSVSSLERAGASATGSRALAERAKAVFKELVDKRDFQKIRSALYFPHEFVLSGGFPSRSNGQFNANSSSASAVDGRDVFTTNEHQRGFSQADEDAQRQLMLIFDSDHRTMLHSACMRGDIDMISVFLPPISKRVAGQVLSCPDGQGRTCFHAAAISGITEAMLGVMKVAGADRVRDLMRDVDNAGNTCLHLAAIRGHVSLCLSLLRVWSCPVEMYNIRGYSPLHEAIEGSHITVVKMLLEECPQHALSTLANEARDTALHVAVRMRPVSMGIVQQLVKYGCKGSRANLFGVRPTELAMQVGAWLAADIMDSSSPSELQDTRKDAQAAAAASAAVVASGPFPPTATDYWGPSRHASSLVHAESDVILHQDAMHDQNAAYTGGECEREIAIDIESSFAHTIDVIVVPSVGASSSERAMLAAPYSVAVRMRLQSHATEDIAPQSGEDGGRSGAAVDAHDDASQGTAYLSPRLSGHVHPSLALSSQVERQQRLLYKDEAEKRPIAVDITLSTTTTLSASQNIMPIKDMPQQLEENQPLDAPQQHAGEQGQRRQAPPVDSTDVQDSHCIMSVQVSSCDPFDIAAGIAAGSVEAVNTDVAAVVQHVLSSIELNFNTSVSVDSYSSEPADPATMQRMDAGEHKQQRAAVVVREESGDRCPPLSDVSWLELEDSIVNARESSAGTQASAAAATAAAASWTDWDELMEPPRRHDAVNSKTSQQNPLRSPRRECASDACTVSHAVPPVPALTARFVRMAATEDDSVSTNDYVDSNVQLIYVGSDVRASGSLSAAGNSHTLEDEQCQELARAAVQGNVAAPVSADAAYTQNAEDQQQFCLRELLATRHDDDNSDGDDFSPAKELLSSAELLPPAAQPPSLHLDSNGASCSSAATVNELQQPPTTQAPAAVALISPRCILFFTFASRQNRL